MGGIRQKKLDAIHKIQKKVLRILFGDKETFKDKFNTCARAREHGQQVLGTEFYQKEHTKPLFEKHFILTVHNLYNYHCFLETFKILKHRAPFPLFNNYQNSRRKYLTYIQLIPPLPSNNFTYRSSIIWNYIRPKLELNDISTSTSSVKSNLRQMLHTNQHKHHKVEWLPSLDHNVSKLN